MSTSFNARILKEIKLGITSDLFDFFFDGEGKYGELNNAYLRFTIPSGTYQGQVHLLRIKFMYGSNQPYSFPKDPPNVVFETPIYHTNISTGGAICLDVIKPEKWSSMYGLEQIFNSIIALLDDPNTSSPFNGEASRKYTELKGNPAKYSQICMDYYREKMNSETYQKLWKLLQASEFEMDQKTKLTKYGIPSRLWPTNLLEPSSEKAKVAPKASTKPEDIDVLETETAKLAVTPKPSTRVPTPIPSASPVPESVEKVKANSKPVKQSVKVVKK
jgi:ubiquitin-protein ligase